MRLVRVEVRRGEKAVSLRGKREQLGCDRAAVHRRGVVGERFQCRDQSGLFEPIAGLEQLAAWGVDRRAFVHRHHRREHREARCVRPRKVDAVTGQSERGLHEAAPGQPPVPARQRLEPRRQPRYRARRRSDRVVDELRAEENVEVNQFRLSRLLAQAGHGDEAVEIASSPARNVEVHGMAAAEQARHHRLGDAGRNTGCDGGVRSVASVLEDLDSRRHRRRMAASNSRVHRLGRYRATTRTGTVGRLQGWLMQPSSCRWCMPADW